VSRAQAFRWQKKKKIRRRNPYWRWAPKRMTISNTDKWRHSTGKRTCSIRSKINSQNYCRASEHERGNRSFYTDRRIGDENNLGQDGAQESHSNSGLRGWAQFLTSKCIMVMLQPPYSPDLQTCDFILFQKVKLAVKGHHFELTEDIQRAVTQVVNDIPQTAFQGCYKH
jgi:hypothetical protein